MYVTWDVEYLGREAWKVGETQKKRRKPELNSLSTLHILHCIIPEVPRRYVICINYLHGKVGT